MEELVYSVLYRIDENTIKVESLWAKDMTAAVLAAEIRAYPYWRVISIREIYGKKRRIEENGD